MTSVTAQALQPTSKRNLIRLMGLDGNALWVPTSVASSHIPKELSSISAWRDSTSSSSKAPLNNTASSFSSLYFGLSCGFIERLSYGDLEKEHKILKPKNSI
eukprot:TRINITY_DN16360_c0_g2_i2.p1 TRINITY_DN16360_c0_g2~~TRINITY_DN16360_c0_g2_i2.p1  ORF type:complete len:102 (-),score=21.47 TRINITY_DN16360_c0_g2_i2:758-1063(-)